MIRALQIPQFLNIHKVSKQTHGRVFPHNSKKWKEFYQKLDITLDQIFFDVSSLANQSEDMQGEDVAAAVVQSKPTPNKEMTDGSGSIYMDGGLEDVSKVKSERVEGDKMKDGCMVEREVFSGINVKREKIDGSSCPVVERHQKTENGLKWNQKEIVIHSEVDCSGGAVECSQNSGKRNINACEFEVTEELSRKRSRVPVFNPDFVYSPMKIKKEVKPQNRNYKCRKCDFVTDSNKKLKIHSQEHVIESECSTTFRSYNATQENIFRCTQCEYVTEIKSNLIMHEMKHPKIKDFKCSKCIFETKFMSSFRRHELVHFKVEAVKKKAKEKRLSEMQKQALVKRRFGRAKGVVFICEKCGYETRVESNYTKHLVKHVKVETEQPDDEALADNSKVDENITGMPDDTIDEKAFVGPHKKAGKEKLFKCRYCVYTTKHKKNVKPHEERHANGRILSCVFGDMYTKSNEKKSKPYSKLQAFNVEFKHNSSLGNVKDKSKELQALEKESTVGKQLVQQKICEPSVNDSYPKVYKCSHCSFTSKYKTCFQNHAYMHNLSKSHRESILAVNKELNSVEVHKETLFKCGHCAYVSNNRINIRIHENIHSNGSSSIAGSRSFDKGFVQSGVKSDCDSENNCKSQKFIKINDYHCSKCNFVSKDFQNFEQHKRESHKQTQIYRCSQCNFTSNNRKNIITHYEIEHETISNICTGANKRTIQKLGSESAMNSQYKHKAFKCSYCDYSTKYRQQLLYHYRSKHGGKRKFGQFVITDKNKNGERVFRCTKCSFVSLYKHSAIRHYERHCDSSKLTKKPIYVKPKTMADGKTEAYKCVRCDFISVYKNCLQRHYEAIHGIMVKTFRSVSDVSRERDSLLNPERLTNISSQVYRCSLCDFVSSHAGSMDKHITVSHFELGGTSSIVLKTEPVDSLSLDSSPHSPSSSDSSSFPGSPARPDGPPSNCPSSSGNSPLRSPVPPVLKKIDLNISSKSRSEETNDSLRPIRKRKKIKIHSCSMCSYTTKFRFNIIKHESSHRFIKHEKAVKSDPEDLPYSCSYCDYTSKSSTRFQVHLLGHTEDRPYICKICGYRANTQKRLEDHSFVHSDAKLFECQLCHFKTKRMRNLTQHQWIHRDTKRFRCENCGYQTNYPCSIRDHKHYGRCRFYIKQKEVIEI